jgi:hypothetical protein
LFHIKQGYGFGPLSSLKHRRESIRSALKPSGVMPQMVQNRIEA